VAKSDSLRCIKADQILIENAERFARIDLDLSDFEKNTLNIAMFIRPAIFPRITPD